MFMISKLIRFIRGYVTIKISAKFPERFINICMIRKIAIWDIKQISDSSLTLKMSRKDFLKIASAARKTKTKVKIVSKHGLYHIIRLRKKRKLFFFGMIIFFSFIFVMSNFIWSIEINGLTYTSEDSVRQSLKNNGLHIGTFKRNIDQLQLKNSVLLEQSDLSWIWVDIRGTRAIVNVSQRKLPPEISNNSSPCDIVASKDGIIKSYNATCGTTKIKVGDSVLAGQTLISGTMTSEIIKPRIVKATGEVFARTWYTETATFSSHISPFYENGKKKTYHSINIFGGNINLFFKKNHGFETYNQYTTQTDVKFFGINSGIKITSHSFCQTESVQKTLSENELLEFAENELLNKISSKLSSKNELLNKNISFKKFSSDSYEITLTAEFCEQIGVSVPIETEIFSNSTYSETN